MGNRLLIKTILTSNILKKIYRFYLNKYYVRYAYIPTGKFVSITFDDVPQKTFEFTHLLSDDFNISFTFYVCPGLSSRWGNALLENKLYNFSDLANLVDSGHEIAHHTFSHIDLLVQSGKKITSDLEKELIFYKHNYIQTSLNFAYPYGRFGLRAKKICSTIFRSCRSIQFGINSRLFDINSLKAISLAERSGSMDLIENILKSNSISNNPLWIIFFGHDIDYHHSSVGCTPHYLRNIISMCQYYNYNLMTVRDVMRSVQIIGK